LQAIWSGVPQAPLSGGGMPVRPLASQAAQGALAYEAGIAQTGELPTRDNAHDWYNALVWLAYPQTKAMINSLQVHEGRQTACAGSRGANGRTRRRDALTLLDENGAVLVTADPAMADALHRFDWQALFVQGRAQWQHQATLWVLGHALLDKLEQPRINLCAHVLVWVQSPDAFQRWRQLPVPRQRQGLDSWLATKIGDGLDEPAQLSPLPVLGVPGWWDENASSDFYNNTAVFRAGRRCRPSV
jgi:hypothetical protein